MKTKIELNLKPFLVPSYVDVVQEPKLREDGFSPEIPKFALGDLDSTALNQMCEEFTANVFKKAGKTRPPTCV